MACVLVSAAAGVGVAVAKRFVKKYENTHIKMEEVDNNELKPIKWSKKLDYLELTLFSGSFILGIEHMIHGEIVPYFPFLTAMNSPADTIEMIKEMSTVGVGMLAVLVLAWGIGVVTYEMVRRKKARSIKEGK